MFECFHCGQRAVSWDCDYDFDDFGYDGVGIVQCLHCNNCGARIEYRIDFDDEQETVDENNEETDKVVDTE